MKKITYILAVAALVGTTLFTSCKKTDTAEPTIAFIPDATTATKNWGEIITFTVVLNSDANTKLDKLDITRQFGSAAATAFTSSSLTGTNQNYAFIDTVPSGITTIKYSFTVTDKNSKTATKDFTVTVTTPSQWGAIKTINGFAMDNQWVNGGVNFYGVNLTTAALDIASAKAKAADIDFVFGHRSALNGGAFMGAPNSTDAAVIYDNTGTNKLSTWSIRNKTLFKTTTLTPAQFALCSNDSLIQGATAVGVNNDSYKTVKKDEVVAFITAGGKKGLMRINTVSGSQDTQTPGQINFDIKWQDK